MDLTELTSRGRENDVADVTLVCNLSVSQSRSVTYPVRRCAW